MNYAKLREAFKEDLKNAPLIKAKVDRVALGPNWPLGVAQLIETHEKKYVGLVTRKGIHVLIDRYVAEYLPDQYVAWSDRKTIVRTIQSRHGYRFTSYWENRTRQWTREAIAVGLASRVHN